MQYFAASGFKQVFDKSQTSQRQVSNKMSTQNKRRKLGRRPGFRQDRCNGIWPLRCMSTLYWFSMLYKLYALSISSSANVDSPHNALCSLHYFFSGLQVQ